MKTHQSKSTPVWLIPSIVLGLAGLVVLVAGGFAILVGYFAGGAAGYTQSEMEWIDEYGLESIVAVETDLQGYAGKTFVLEGTIELSNYYNYGYSDEADHRWAFRVRDRTGRAMVYVPRGRDLGEGLRDECLHAGRPLRGVFLVVYAAHDWPRHGNARELFAELRGYSVKGAR